MSFQSCIELISLKKSTFISLSFSSNFLLYSILNAPFVDILNTEYSDTNRLGLFIIAITSLFPSEYVWLSIWHSKFFISMFVIVSLPGLLTYNLILASSLLLVSIISIDKISGKSLSSTSGSSIYSCVGIHDDILSHG